MMTSAEHAEPADYRPGPTLLQDRVILVTGAGRGIGRVAAETFARHGASVILHGRDVARIEAVYDAIQANGGPKPAILPLDLATASDRDCSALAQAVERELGRLDGVLHNASHLEHLAPLADETLDTWLKLLRVNLAAVFALTRACTPLLRAAPDAAVVLTGETHGLRPAAYWGGFAVSKSALLAYNTIQAQEWELHPNLRINLVVPGPVNSPQRGRTHPGEAPAERAPVESLMPLYLYLMGPDSRGVSGKVFERPCFVTLDSQLP
jgi:NAD(P)-dependent dehydrogenase (short-subunit alcohol dehydrogenase family)